MSKVIQRFPYIKIEKDTSDDGYRVYKTPTGDVASVTTILSETKNDEDKQVLENWRNRIGHKKAATITTNASSRGTVMHTWLERYIDNDPKTPGSNLIQQQSYKMAQQIIQNGLSHVNEYWGSEISLYFPELYAGTTDVVGVWKGKPAIIDFKQSNKPKKEEWVGDYKLQLVAYALAHNELYGTNIRTGVIMMCTPDMQYQQFEIHDHEFDHYVDKWLDRVGKFYGC